MNMPINLTLNILEVDILSATIYIILFKFCTISFCLIYQILFYIIYNGNIYNIGSEKSTSDSVNCYLGKNRYFKKRRANRGVSDFVENFIDNGSCR